MVEDAEKKFLDDTIQEEDESELEQEEKTIRRDPEMEKEVANAVDEILEEARIETSKARPKQPPPLPPTKVEKSTSEEQPPQKPAKPQPPAAPPKPCIIRPKKEEKPKEKQTEPDAFGEDKFEANFEAAFEANFDDAFAPSDAPKQVVGGRASIPEELEPDQLARLQNLKESNA